MLPPPEPGPPPLLEPGGQIPASFPEFLSTPDLIEGLRSRTARFAPEPSPLGGLEDEDLLNELVTRGVNPELVDSIRGGLKSSEPGAFVTEGDVIFNRAREMERESQLKNLVERFLGGAHRFLNEVTPSIESGQAPPDDALFSDLHAAPLESGRAPQRQKFRQERFHPVFQNALEQDALHDAAERGLVPFDSVLRLLALERGKKLIASDRIDPRQRELWERAVIDLSRQVMEDKERQRF